MQRKQVVNSTGEGWDSARMEVIEKTIRFLKKVFAFAR